MAPLPPIAPYPPVDVRAALPAPDWVAALAAYNALLAHRLSLPPSALLSDAALHAFLRSYFHELSRPPPRILTAPAGARLPEALVAGPFLLSLAVALPKSAAVRNTLGALCANHRASVEASISSFKGTAVLPQLLPGKQPLPLGDTQSLLRSLSLLFLAAPSIAELFVTGSDFLDALIDLYTTHRTAHPALRKSILRLTYIAFTSLLPTAGATPSKPNYSLLLDHLYSLQTLPLGSKEHTFLTALISTTTFLHRLRSAVLDEPSSRLTALTSVLEEKYTTNGRAPRPRQKPTAAAKGKSKATNNDDDALPRSLETQYTLQVLEVFPELSGSESWVRATLAKLNGDVESLIKGYLDKTIYEENPPPPAIATSTSPRGPHQRRSSLQAPHTPMLHVRKNIYDNDDLDTLSANALSSLHIGKRDSPAQIGEADSSTKTAIWAALAAFDEDDDERDDTYDAADVGGAVDTANTEPDPAAPPATAPQQDAPNPEKILYTLWTTSTPGERAAYFARDSATRRSNARGELKRKTGLTDEAIEGWGLMLERDLAGRRMRELERRFGEGAQGGGGNLNAGAIERTRWRRPEEDGEEGGEGGGYAHRGGRGGGGWEGRGRGRGGAGGHGAANTPRDRARKEANKSSRANHSRREGHARKMARGMGGGGAV
ncbi:hypothetical protein EV426DRAFT_707929 [Tirmania nivea]|nr:hypothetical protein EV426DRAFT_707929 [Tirmania nivea]